MRVPPLRCGKSGRWGGSPAPRLRCMCRYGMHAYKSRLVCLGCRSSFKKAGGPGDGDRCPRCRAVMINQCHEVKDPPAVSRVGEM